MLSVKARGVRTVLVERLDRLARDLMVQEAALSYFTQHGFTIVSVMEPDLRASDPSRIAFRQIWACSRSTTSPWWS
jgi:DNA invertase Pin-like site-specific DNA recombinase